MCREKSKIGSSLKRTKKKCYSPIKECFRYMENMLCDLEKSSLAIWREHGRHFGENMFGVLEKTWSAFWRNRGRRFGEIVVGVLEKTWSAFLRRLCTGVRYEVAYSLATISVC